MGRPGCVDPIYGQASSVKHGVDMDCALIGAAQRRSVAQSGGRRRPEGKMRRRGRFSGYRSDWKKAYVKLKAGEKVPDFAEI